MFSRLLVLLVISICFTNTSFASIICQQDPSLVCSLSGNKVIIKDVAVGKANRDINNLFGIHSLWWGVQKDLYDKNTNTIASNVITILRDSKVAFIRNGGGANESDWHKCIGKPADRIPQKVVDWAGPMPCIFGLEEYEALNDKLNTSISWNLANLVGYEKKILPIDLLSKSANEEAGYIKNLAQNRTRYWELGNELELGWTQWHADIIAQRGLPIARSILQADPKAVLVVPLASFKTATITDDDAHNDYLIHQFKPVAHNFSLHLYYDNPPEGPSVTNRLQYVWKVTNMLQQNGILDPGIWVTEYSRWPAGNPSMPDWGKNWYQTNDYEAVLSTADFLIGLTQIPAVKGAIWHGLRAGPWNLISINNASYNVTLMSELFKFLSPKSQYKALETITSTDPDLNILGGYALRATAFTETSNKNTSNTVIWVVNRSDSVKRVDFTRDVFSKSNMADTSVINMIPSINEVNSHYQTKFITTRGSLPINSGTISLTIPAQSVSVITISVPK